MHIDWCQTRRLTVSMAGDLKLPNFPLCPVVVYGTGLIPMNPVLSLGKLTCGFRAYISGERNLKVTTENRLAGVSQSALSHQLRSLQTWKYMSPCVPAMAGSPCVPALASVRTLFSCDGHISEATCGEFTASIMRTIPSTSRWISSSSSNNYP